MAGFSNSGCLTADNELKLMLLKRVKYYTIALRSQLRDAQPDSFKLNKTKCKCDNYRGCDGLVVGPSTTGSTWSALASTLGEMPLGSGRLAGVVLQHHF
jgi:hypothetical protein